MEQNLKKNDCIENKAELDKKAIHKKRVQIISLAVFALFLIVGTIAAIPIAKELSADLKTHEGIQNLTEKFSRYSGIWGSNCLFVNTNNTGYSRCYTSNTNLGRSNVWMVLGRSLVLCRSFPRKLYCVHA